MTHQPDLFSDAPAAETLAWATVEAPAVESDRQAPPTAPSWTVPENLAEVLACYQDAVSDHPRRVQFRSAIRRIGKVLRLPLEHAPAAPHALRPLLAEANLALAGIKPSNWRTLKSAALAALREVGVEVLPSRSSTILSPEWAKLLSRVEDRGGQIGLSRLLRYFTEVGIAPEDVSVQCFRNFRGVLTERSLLSDADRAYRQFVEHWNKAAATSPGWPAVRVPPEGDPRRFSIEWHELPPSFVADVEGFLAAKSDTDPLSDDYARPTRSITAVGRRKSIRVLASAVVLSGEIKMQDLESLEVLSRPQNVRAALRYLRDIRSQGKVTEGHINHAWLMRTIAKHWVRDEARTQELKILISNLTAHVRKGAGKGMTTKNRERLLQFTVPANVDALVGLPERVYRSTRGVTEPSNSDSVRVMRALQVGILTFVPIRSRNLAQLELGANIVDIGKGTKRTVRIHLPGEITKTYRDYNAPLPRHLFPLIDNWLNVHRPRISPKPSAYLFPSPSGDLRSRDSLTQKLQAFVHRETGLTVNAHLFGISLRSCTWTMTPPGSRSYASFSATGRSKPP